MIKRTEQVKTVISKFKSFWLEDISFVTLLFMLLLVVFVVPVMITRSNQGILLYNVILLSVFLSGIFSTSNKWMILLSSTFF